MSFSGFSLEEKSFIVLRSRCSTGSFNTRHNTNTVDSDQLSSAPVPLANLTEVPDVSTHCSMQICRKFTEARRKFETNFSAGRRQI